MGSLISYSRHHVDSLCALIVDMTPMTAEAAPPQQPLDGVSVLLSAGASCRLFYLREASEPSLTSLFHPERSSPAGTCLLHRDGWTHPNPPATGHYV